MTTQGKIRALLRALRSLDDGELLYFTVHDHDPPQFAVAEMASWLGDEADFVAQLLDAVTVCRWERKEIKYVETSEEEHHRDLWFGDDSRPYYRVVVFFRK